MANLDLSNLSLDFDMESRGIDFDAVEFLGRRNFDYTTTVGDLVEVSGSGFSGTPPSRGTADSLQISLEGGSAAGADITIDGFSRAVDSFVVNISGPAGTRDFIREESSLFWSTLLGGDDEMTLGETLNAVNLAGDALFVDNEDGRTTGGDDMMSGAIGATSGLYGDFFDVTQGVAEGGADEIRASYVGPLGARANAPGAELVDMTISGDVREVEDDTTLFGGDDVMVLRRGGLATGDAFVVHGGLVGGDDHITGGGSVRLVGDAWNVEDGANATGGDDVIRGGRGSQILDGDFGTLRDDRAIGGDDIIRGGRGDDFIFGEAELGRVGQVKGGADRLFGNAGDDHIYGQSGFDKLWGGAGDDVLSGGPGRDVIFTGSGSDTVEVRSVDGVEIVRDFDLGFDHISLATSATRFGDLDISERNGNAVIVSDGARIVLAGVDADDLNGSHFDFHSV